MKKLYYIKLILIISWVLINNENAFSQINNYWSMGSNTSSTLLGGAVVGVAAGEISVFYNPAAIRIEDQKQIALNASLLNFDMHAYNNALGYNRDLDYLEWGVKPRFLSYKFRINDDERLNFQLAVFSRDDQLIELWDYKTVAVKSEVGNDDLNYTASYDLDRRYKDYWMGVGASYVFSPKFSMGFTLFGSGKSLRYYQSSSIDIDPVNGQLKDNAHWSSTEKQYLYVISIIPKFGFLYTENRVSYGLSITIPSVRLWGDGYSKRTLRYSNVIYEGQKKDDYLHSDYNNYMVANIKEPFAVAFGMTFKSLNNKSEYFFSSEYFAPIETYRMLDNTHISNWGQEEFHPGDDFLSYKYGAKEVFNVALGYRHIINENFAIMSGLKTNFSAYEPSSSDEWGEINEFVNMSPSLYHASLGVQFRFKANTVIVGAEYSYGKENNLKQLSNYGYPGIFDEEKHIALQNRVENTMSYTSNSIGFYIGYAFDF